MRCLKDGGIYKAYWQLSGEDSFLGRILKTADISVKDKLFKLVSGEAVNVELSDGIELSYIHLNTASLWATLLYSGYLKVIDKSDNGRHTKYSVRIPNKELLEAYDNIVQHWFMKILTDIAYKDLLTSLSEGDIEQFGLLLQRYLDESSSSDDLGPKSLEKEYHLLVFGMFFILHDVTSNGFAGKGRPDIAIIPKVSTEGVAVIFEFKRVEKEEYLEQSVKEA